MHPLIEKHLPEIQNLCKKHAVERLYLFGSYATGQAKADSDVDFLVSFLESNHSEYRKSFFGLLYALEDLLEKEIDLVTEPSLSNPYLIESIEESRVKVYEYKDQKISV